MQGDADRLHELGVADGADLVLCHSVLEYVDDPATAVKSISSVVRPGGAVRVAAELVGGRWFTAGRTGRRREG